MSPHQIFLHKGPRKWKGALIVFHCTGLHCDQEHCTFSVTTHFHEDPKFPKHQCTHICPSKSIAIMALSCLVMGLHYLGLGEWITIKSGKLDYPAGMKLVASIKPPWGGCCLGWQSPGERMVFKYGRRWPAWYAIISRHNLNTAHLTLA